MNEVITHDGVQYRKVDREAQVGDKVVVTDTVNSALVPNGTISVVNRIEGGFPDDNGEANDALYLEGVRMRGKEDAFVWRHEVYVLEPLADATPTATDAKPGDRVRIVAADDKLDVGYKNGDVYTVKKPWANGLGADVFDDHNGDDFELYAEEFEIVRELSDHRGDYVTHVRASDDQIALHEANKNANLLDAVVEYCTPDEVAFDNTARHIDEITSSLRQGIIGQSRVSGPITLAELVDEVTQHDPTVDDDDLVNSPQHYNAGQYEIINVIDDITKSAASAGASGSESYMLGNVIKYVARYRHKNGAQDLRKAAWYLDRMIAELDANQPES